ncbi:putative ABC transporter substrate-binding protein [Gordonia hirsuta DSM 44140 = NBRC 16056]|uniref:Putative ABC transporter substrate-binding protein n=1 Tax=Gordonia hirsuta DSM 44140 = NBRC 16056 TaxID=1121927 RepID=L7L8B7_9ACTN|nr:ABC transporter substrate-binding protein [Gordonia hirsuta]GAC56302.1 putative ABC transporter substrate-binding protein [Gordonia hirsuta DSM 44140 = NBRC 16056]
MRTLQTVVTVTTAAALSLGLSACGTNEPSADGGTVSLTNCGRTVTLPAPAARGVTVNQGATESALTVGAGDQLVGTAYLDDAIAPALQAAYDKVPVLAPKYPSLEQVLTVHPDLVAASYSSAFGDKGIGTREELAGLGIATYVSPFGCENKDDRPAASWEAIAGEVSDYGVLFGRSAQADEVNTRMRQQLSDLERDAHGKGVRIFWWDNGTDTPSAGAGQGGPQLIMDAVGATNVFADQPGNWADVSWEQVLRADPEVIVLIDADFSSADSKKAYLQADPVLKNLTAVREQSYLVLPFSESTPGARTIDGAVALSDHLGSR